MSETNPLRVIDLFAGIGGIRLGFEQAAEDLGTKVECVFSSEWDKFAQQTYAANFGERPHGDITDPDVRAAIPDEFDILLAGFPCQPFSLAGVSKKNALGRPHGFDDPTQGTLFHEIVEILRVHRPKAFLLENVKHLQGHDKGRTFAIISEALDTLGYSWDHRVINASTRVPQNRERIYIVGYRDDLGIDAVVPELESEPVALKTILHEYVDGGDIPRTPWDRADRELADYTLTPNLWKYLWDYKAKHRAAGNGFGFGEADPDGISRTLSARYHKDGSEILIPQCNHPLPHDEDLMCDVVPRRLTPRECARLQGYPDDYRTPCSDTQSYRQFGNSVAVPVIRSLAQSMIAAIG